MPCHPLQWLVQRTLHPGDSEADRRAKEIVVPLLPFIAFVAFFSWVTDVEKIVGYWYGALWIWLVTAGLLIYVLATRRLTVPMVEVTCVAYVAGVVAVDWASAAANVPRVWACVVLVMDILLAVGARKAAQRVALGVTFAWLLVDVFEGAFTLGLYDLPYWSEGNGQKCDCSDPPCATPLALAAVSFLIGVTVLFVDYMATRSFAEGLHRQTSRLAASITVAEQVAESLALFDLEAAQGALDRHSSMPRMLRLSFERLLDNLASYRPYLPQSCLPQHAGEELEAAGTRTSASPSPPSAFEVSRVNTVPDHPGSPGSSPAGSWLDSDGPRLSSLATQSDTALAGTPTGACASLPHSGRRVSTAVGECVPATRWAGNVPHQRRLTLLHCNRSGFLGAAADLAPAELIALLGDEVEHFVAAVNRQKGCVDLLSADHLSASFGAPRALATHRVAAVRCAMGFRTGEGEGGRAATRTAAACSGQALCGDFGSSAAQRFMVVGGVSSLLAAAERAAAAWGSAVLVDDLIREDCETTWDCRVRMIVTFPKRGSRTPFGLWEVVSAKSDDSRPVDEWMYQLEAASPNPWAQYNAAVCAWCQLQWDRAREHTDRPLSAAAEDSAVAAALGKVRDALRHRADPPAGPLCATSTQSPAPL
eukprot:TRINITY_DN177_c0_g4_i1.p1 TRINITY_DN177_c0_g4~~TRINITY_DN177_c0_g4_i1.p1  ORF type:complete len:649 (+),score=118.80 TRINITY_DN177_c0_g4_i1:92-2038(+)